MTRTRNRRRALIAIGAGVGIAAVALASAAGLGGIIVEQIGAESRVVADPFTDGVIVDWGDPEYDADSRSYVVSYFVVERDSDEALPAGRLMATVADADGETITEATAEVNGFLSYQYFFLTDPIPAEDIHRVAVVFTTLGAAGEANYLAGAGQVSKAPGAVWQSSGDGTVAVVDTAEGEPILQIAAGGSVLHDAGSRHYEAIDNTYDAKLDWSNFFTGATNGEIDPETGDEITTTGLATVVARVDAGSSLWLDVRLAYGAEGEPLNTTILTCELEAGTTWTTVELADCWNTGAGLDTRWISTESWSLANRWGQAGMAPGDPLSVTAPIVDVMTVAGYGFHVEGGGAAQIQGLELRDQTIRFMS